MLRMLTWNVRVWWKADVDRLPVRTPFRGMDIDLPKLARFLSQPITGVEVALPTSLKRAWPWPPKVRTNIAAIRTGEGALIFHYRLVSDSLLDGIFEDNPFEGYSTEGTLALLALGDTEGEQIILSSLRPMQSPEPLEMVPLNDLFPNCAAIYVPGSTAVEVAYTQIIREGAFRFDVSGIRIFSADASTLIERGNGSVLECSVA
jgi:hypothetical protein